MTFNLFSGYLIKQILKNKNYKNCGTCKNALTYTDNSLRIPEQELVTLKSRGRLIHANKHFFHLIRNVEENFTEFCRDSRAFELTTSKVLDTYPFQFPCLEHGSELLSYAVFYYVRLRMRQFTYQENQKKAKKSANQRKLSKHNKT